MTLATISDAPVRLAPWPRPANIPSDWMVFCAPRPLFGTVTWKGEWIAGCHYAALDFGGGPEIDQCIRDNLDLGAVVVLFVADDRVKPVLAAEYRRGLTNDDAILAAVLSDLERATAADARAYLAKMVVERTYRDAHRMLTAGGE